MADNGYPSTVAAARTAGLAAALAATLGLAAASWVIAVREMHGMDMGVATRLGSFAFFIAIWVVMMAAMMLPCVAPARPRPARPQRDRHVVASPRRVRRAMTRQEPGHCAR